MDKYEYGWAQKPWGEDGYKVESPQFRKEAGAYSCF